MPKWGKYKKCYRKEWESDPSLKTWISPVVGDESKAFCKYSQSEIRAQLNDLKEHANTHKKKTTHTHIALCTKCKNFYCASGSSRAVSDQR